MIKIDGLSLFLECLSRWKSPPSRDAFEKEYIDGLRKLGVEIEGLLEDFGAYRGRSMYEHILGLEWKSYRSHCLEMDAAFEIERLDRSLESIESFFGKKLTGKVTLFGSFLMMDGYARFHRGGHNVFLGVDEDHGRGAYLDILTAHELCHVVRESSASVWKGWGLDPKMTHDDFVEKQPPLEHLMNEGYSCVVSEILNPGHPPHLFTYQSKDSFEKIMEVASGVDRVIHAGIKMPGFSYREWYHTEKYVPEVARFAHYVWAWAWVKNLVHTEFGGDARKLAGECSKNWIDHALEFKLNLSM